MAEYKAIRVEKGNGGFGGPLTIQGTEKKNKVMYITGGGIAPEILPKIVELSGLEPVNGFKTSAPEDELALVIIDCGGTLRCGLYPKKRIPTININPVGKAGPLAQFIKEDIYVSGVTNANISLADGSEAPVASEAAPAAAEAAAPAEEKKGGIDTTKKLSEQMAESGKGNALAKIGLGAGKVVATFNQAARDAVQTAINTLLPFMAFVSMLIGIINGTGFGTFFSTLLQPPARPPSPDSWYWASSAPSPDCPPSWDPAPSSPRSWAASWALRSLPEGSPLPWPWSACSR